LAAVVLHVHKRRFLVSGNTLFLNEITHAKRKSQWQHKAQSGAYRQWIKTTFAAGGET
jgi:hypothetical protein